MQHKTDRIHQVLETSGKIFDAVWSYNLVTVAGNHIKVANIVFAMLLFFIGIKYSKNFSNLIKRYIHQRIPYDKDAANAVEKIILYLSFCLYIITILEISNIPLSTFAFIGGALAIGIGLGAQTMISNFISSFTIMVERPLKIGDIVEIEGVIGTVSAIGSRCVILTTFSNVEVLIPNSKLMQNTLVNWTLSDSAVKHQIEITIPKIADKKASYPDFINILYQIFVKLDFTKYGDIKPEIYLTKIEDEHVTFLVDLYCDVDKIQNPEHVKGVVNLALIEHLTDYDFKVEYPKIVQVAPILETSQKSTAF